MSILQRIINSFLQGPIYIIFFGFIFFAVGAGLSYHQYTLERSGVQAQGEVINLTLNCDDDGCTYAPVVRFQTRDGRTVTFESSYSSSPPSHDVGEKLTVIYPPDQPEKADLKGEGRVFRIIFTGVGGTIIIVGGVMFLKKLKESFSVS